MSVQPKRSQVLPSSDSAAFQSCPLCGTPGKSLAIFESGIEKRFGMAVLPVSDYGQVRCGNCGLLYLNAPIDSNYLVDLYAQESVEWQREYVGEKSVTCQNGATNEEEFRRFDETVELAGKYRRLQGVRWLDFGCQTGDMGEIAAKRYAAQMFGVEVSPDYASRADIRWGSRDAVRDSLAGFTDQGQKFDVISAIETLEHLATPWETVRAFREALSPGGVLVVSVPSAQYFRLKYYVFKAYRMIFSRRELRERALSPRPSLFGLCHTHVYNFSARSLSALIAKGGMSTLYVGGIGWSKRLWYLDRMARLIATVTFGRVLIFPSVIAVARTAD